MYRLQQWSVYTEKLQPVQQRNMARFMYMKALAAFCESGCLHPVCPTHQKLAKLGMVKGAGFLRVSEGEEIKYSVIEGEEIKYSG